MAKFTVDLSNCAREPIHIPGAIQSWGFLVVINISTNVITYVSANIVEYLNVTGGTILGQKLSFLEDYITSEGEPNPLTAYVETAKRKENAEQEVYPVSVGGEHYDLLIHRNGSLMLLEFESKSKDSVTDIHTQIGRSISTVLSASELPEILDQAACVVKDLIGYDRVMIYKFMEDAHGKVVAECKEDELDPFFDLHYPASDIPAQARELYKLNRSRIIADADAETSPILALKDAPLDLTHSILRSVSPIHIQYLKNMGVASSFSISIVCRGALWGLIACHNYTPKFINHRVREGAKLLGQIISSTIEFKEEELLTRDRKKHETVLERIISQMRTERDIKEVLLNSQLSFRDVVKASGAVLIFEGAIVKDGSTPTDDQISAIVNWLSNSQTEHTFHTNNLASQMPGAESFADVASGILACTISRELKEYVIWFKPEYVQSISWAGNPEKPVEVDAEGGLRISPRKSFDSFKEIVKNTSENWKQYEQILASRLKDEILYIVNKKASEVRILNEKLKDAYEELETFSSTISHDLRTPLAVVKNYAQLLERNRTLDDDGKRFAARISVGVERMNRLITEVLEYSRVGRSEICFDPVDMGQLLETIKQELLIALNPDDLIFEIEGTPPIAGDKTMLYQVFLNLINNAIKYSRLSKPSKVKITGTESEFEILYKIEDNGIGISAEHFGKVFELFRRVNVSEDFEGTGVGLAIVKRILDKHKAKVWIESEVGVGTTFFLSFRKFT